MSKITDAQKILKSLGLQEAQQNELSALILLALSGIKKNDDWSNASKRSMRITKEIMTFVNKNYKKTSPYAPNTRETFRRQVLHQFVQAGVVCYNPDDPNLPVNSPKAHYALTDEALVAIKAFGTPMFKNLTDEFLALNDDIQRKYAAERLHNKIPVIINGEEYLLSPGKHNKIQIAVINEFAPRFAAGSKLLYLGDTENKDLYVDNEGLHALSLTITEHSKLPDVIICDDEQGWLFLIEVVTSHGPVSAKRVIELEEFTKNCPYGIVYVTAFPDAKEFKKHVTDIAWETEVWLANSPDHMIHFNGDRFIGPR